MPLLIVIGLLLFAGLTLGMSWRALEGREGWAAAGFALLSVACLAGMVYVGMHAS